MARLTAEARGIACYASGTDREEWPMAEKTIRQQPVTLAHVSQVVYILYPTGGIDSNYLYTPVDETGKPVGETRSLTQSHAGAAAKQIKTWITNEVWPFINAEEGTYPRERASGWRRAHAVAHGGCLSARG